jgi:hypothetical protein
MRDIRYLPESAEIEMTDDHDYPSYRPLDSLELVDANERELGTETEYRTPEGIHIFFYPDGVLSDWYEEQSEIN